MPDTTVRIYINPKPEIAVIVEDTLCFDEGVGFNVSTATPSENTSGEWVYVLSTTISAGSVTGYRADGTYTDMSFSEPLVNSSPDLQWIEYTFKPRIYKNENDYCGQGSDTTVRIYINPQPLIILSYQPDTVLCNIDSVTFNVQSGNGSHTGGWVYDIHIDASNETSVSGEYEVTDHSALSITQYLTNLTDQIQWVDYTFIPKIKDPSGNQQYCANGIQQKIRIWLNPIPHLEVNAEDTIYCDSAFVNFDIRNINGLVYGDKVYEIIIDYNPSNVSSTLLPGNRSLVSIDFINDSLINLTNTLQRIDYTFRPKIWNPGTLVPGKHCDNGIDTTISIWINPTPGINAYLNTDTVVCDTSAYEISFTTTNPDFIGEAWYYVTSSYTGNVSGVKPSGWYRMSDMLSDILINNTRNLQIVSYNIKPAFRNTQGYSQDCLKGIDTTLVIYLNPTPVFDSIYVSDTVICNNSYIDFRFYNSQITTGKIVYTFEGVYPGSVSGVTGGDGEIVTGFTDTLVNISTLIQDVYYSFTPVIDDMVNGLQCSKGIALTKLVKVAPELTSVATADTFLGGRNIRCFGESNGKISLFPEGGYYLQPYQFHWEHNGNPLVETGPSVTGLPVGMTHFSIEDAIGCSYSDSVILTQPEIITVDDSIAEVSCKGKYDGSIHLEVAGGTAGYNFSWFGPDYFFWVNSPDSLIHQRSGNYRLRLTDRNGCYYEDTYYIGAPVAVIIDPTYSHFGNYNITCNGASDGIVYSNARGKGNAANFGYTWRDWNGNVVDTLRNLMNFPNGTYFLNVKDSVGCEEDVMVSLWPILLHLPIPGQGRRILEDLTSPVSVLAMGLLKPPLAEVIPIFPVSNIPGRRRRWLLGVKRTFMILVPGPMS